jgi:glycosyltransferase involved in cell wall biosynthesis
MKIAQISPLIESVPPRLYGGTERVVSYLTEALVVQGHQVALFASGDSVTAAELVPCCKMAIRLDPTAEDFIPHYMLMLDKVMARAAEFDILHFHIDHLHFPLCRKLARRTVTTLHGRQDCRDNLPFYAAFEDMPLVSISRAQRRPIATANFVGTVHHGLPTDLYEPSFQPRGGYAAFLGRISPEKGPVDAIRIASSLGIPLKIAAKVDPADQVYFRDHVKPLLDAPGVEFIGEVDDRHKGEFLRNASVLLFPICWPEPFGLVLIEAMACGTPVLAYDTGAAREVIDDGITGRVVRTIDDAIVALPRVMTIDRHKVRRRFEERFSVERMTNDYLRIYRMLLKQPHPERSLRVGLDGGARVNGDELVTDAGLHVN